MWPFKKKELHVCETMPQKRPPQLITCCKEDEDGDLWVFGDDGRSQVNYCPYCGYRARSRLIKMNGLYC